MKIARITLYWSSLLVVCIGAVALSWGRDLQGVQRNIALDAVTRATTWNTHEGDVQALTDGQLPDDGDAEPFVWNTKGILVFEWERPLTLERVRLYVGEVGNNYQVRAYRGGRLQDEGAVREPEGEQLALVPVDERLTNQWIEVAIPGNVLADNLEVWTLGPTVFYEIEILVRDDTAVEATSWAQVKAQAVPNSP